MFIILAIVGGVLAFLDKEDKEITFMIGVIFFVLGILGVLFTS